MAASVKHPDKLFTLDEANAMLPLVRAITRDMVELARDVIERQQRIEYLQADRDLEKGDPYADELVQSIEDLDRDKDRLRAFVSELLELGVEPKSASEGLVDFPALIDGELVYLCWKLDEPEVQFWHTLEGGFSGRQSLTAGAACGPHEHNQNSAL